MPTILSALAAGLIFGVGLALSGMTDPAVVQGFLDIFGAWNPALLFVMAGAVCLTFIGYRLVFARGAPLLGPRFHVPTLTQIDGPLVIGAAMFGVGWGLAGYCPGPAIASLASGSRDVLLFVIAMVIGMLLAKPLQASLQQLRRPARAASDAG